MKARSPARWLAGLSVVALVVPGSVSAAELHVMISAGFYRVYAELGPAFERATGHRLITSSRLRLTCEQRATHAVGNAARPHLARQGPLQVLRGAGGDQSPLHAHRPRTSSS